jgi:hypothetical protein
MHTEVSSENYSLIRPVTNLDMQPSQKLNMSSGTLSAISPEGDAPDESTMPVGTQIPASAALVVDSKVNARRRRAAQRDENGSGTDSGLAAINPMANSDEASIEHGEGKPNPSDGSGSQVDEEAALAEQIGQLWFSVQLRMRVIRRNSKERAAFKNNLARDLHRYKALLVHTGRSGKWSAFLRRNEIPRATADRYVEKWQRTLTQVVENRLAEPTSQPTAEEVARMVKQMKPKLLRVLTTAEAVEHFLAALGAALQVPRSS